MIWSLYTCAVFPTTEKWIKVIRGWDHYMWLESPEKSVAKHFPESDETQKRHIRQARQGVRLAK